MFSDNLCWSRFIVLFFAMLSSPLRHEFFFSVFCCCNVALVGGLLDVGAVHVLSLSGLFLQYVAMVAVEFTLHSNIIYKFLCHMEL